MAAFARKIPLVICVLVVENVAFKESLFLSKKRKVLSNFFVHTDIQEIHITAIDNEKCQSCAINFIITNVWFKEFNFSQTKQL